MRKYQVQFHPHALHDLTEIHDWIARKAGPKIALGYIDRIEAFCETLRVSPLRGSLRDDLRPNLRVIGFEKRLSIAFAVADDTVVILRIFGKGRDWAAADIENGTL